MMNELSVEELDLISYALYQSFSKLGVIYGNYALLNRPNAEKLQRKINTRIKEIRKNANN